MKKAEVMGILRGMPNELDPEELIHRIYLIRKLDRAELAIRQGKVMSHDEVVRRSNLWLKSAGHSRRSKTSKRSTRSSRATPRGTRT